MAQSGFTPIKLYSSTTPAAAPTAGNLEQGELAINTNDGKLYYEDNAGVVQVLATKAGASGDVVGPASATDNAIARYDGTTGKLIQNSGVTIDDSNNVTGVGNLTFTGTGNRITGDFSNATIASRVLLQSSTTNGQSALGLLPNGTSTQTQYIAFNSTDPANSSYIQALISATEARINSGQLGTGTNLPMTFYTGGSERVRIDTSGNVGIGTSSPASLLSLQKFTAAGLGPELILNNNANSISDAMALTFASGTIGSGARGQIKVTVENSPFYGAMQFFTGASNATLTERMRIAGNGNVQIGTSDDSARLTISGAAGYAGTGISLFETSATARRLRMYQSTGGVIYDATFGSGDNAHLWYIGGGEKARIDTSGNLLVGTTNTDPIGANVTGSIITETGVANFMASAQTALKVGRKTSTGALVDFYYYGASLNFTGGISTSGTTTSYNTSSDYRLKENVAPMTGALEKVAALKPCTYTWKADGSAGQGFIAHELQTVVPDCVSGVKDAVDKDGKPRYQGVDTSFLVATIVAALQELKAEFDVYKLTHP
jgi:hypothetical protein